MSSELLPGSSNNLKDLEQILDGRQAPTKRGSGSQEYQSKLPGWSPSPNDTATQKTAAALEKSMESLNLDAVAASVGDDSAAGAAVSAATETSATVDTKKLSKAERKKLAAEEFAKRGGAPPKREKLSKQERRALQEAQRNAKAGGAPATGGAKAAGGTPQAQKPKPAAPQVCAASAVASANTAGGATVPKPVKKNEPGQTRGVRLQYDDAKRVARRSKGSIVTRTQAQKQVALFSHLPQYERESSLSLNVGFSNKEIHPAVLSLGLKYAEGKITGGNARCVAMLTAFKQVIQDYVTPPNKMLSRDLDKTLRPLIQYLIDCRPHCIGMGNAIRSLRHIISTVPPEASEEEAKKQVLWEIDEYIQSRILLATKAICKNAQCKIDDNDVILVYAGSALLEEILLEAYANGTGKHFRVIVVDSRPHFEGKQMITSLAKAGLQCTYLQINGLSYIMRQVTKVFLGASAFMSNGVAIGRVGTALVAMTAHANNVPVLFCCETYKFSDRVQLDSITHNELRDPDELISSYSTQVKKEVSGLASGNPPQTSRRNHVLSDWRDLPMLKLLNLVYDVTPSEYVSMLVTEVGLIPPTSVPAILREYSKEGNTDPIL